ncbi:MAG: sensor domain-containing diguanylate cyclase [Thermodesulfobacteriota bacterium]
MQKGETSLLKIVTDHMLDLVSLTDMEGNFTFAGKSHAILGYDPADLLGKNVMDFVHPDDYQYVLEEFMAFVSSGEKRTVEYRNRCRNGDFIWLETIGKILKDENKIPCGIVFSSRNITDRKQMEKALKKSDRLASLTVDSLSAHLAILNEKGTIIAVNQAWRQFAESNSAELSKTGEGVNYFDICDNAGGPDAGSAANFASGMRAVLAGEKDEFIAEYPCHSPTEQRWFIGRVTRFPANGETRLVVAHENVTMRKQAEEELENFFSVNLDLLCIADIHGNFLKVNKEWENMLGYTADELHNTKFLDFVHPADMDATLAAMSQLARQKKVINFVNRYKSKEGFYHFIEWRSFPKGDLIYAAARDITEKKRTEEALRESETRLRGIMESTPDAIIMMDHGGAISFWNPAAEEILGYRAKEAIGQNLHELLAPERYHKAFQAAFPEFLKAGRGNAVGKTVELSALHKSGYEIMVALTLSAVSVQERWHAVGVLRDVTEQKKMEEELTLLATTDNLTGLFNRRVFMEKLARETARCQRYNKTAAVMILDLDHFKSINDTYGHAGGDSVLRQFASLLTETIRETDVAGRVGGEEFAVLLPEATVHEAASLAQRILHCVRKSFVATDAGKIRFTTSIGFAQLQADDTHTDQLLARADTALYRAKANGRDRAEAGCDGNNVPEC